MKKIIIPFLLIGATVLVPFFSNAQNTSREVDLRPMLFKDFKPAQVYKKDGTIAVASMNYNTDNQKMIFLANNTYMELTDLEDIIKIIIENSVYVPIDGKIYQKTGRNDLYVSYSNKVNVNEITTNKNGSGAVDSRLSSNTLTNTYVSQNYQTPNGLIAVPNFWILKDGDLVELSNIKKIAKAFDRDKEELKQFEKENHTDLNNYSNVIDLINYLEKEGK